MRAHLVKHRLLLSCKTPQVVSISGMKITSRTAETLLGIFIDSDLNSKFHIQESE